MGRIKSTMIKKAAKQLLEIDLPFNESFEKDKKILGNKLPSKPIRNKVAGYIARLKRMQAEAIQKAAGLKLFPGTVYVEGKNIDTGKLRRLTFSVDSSGKVRLGHAIRYTDPSAPNR